MEAPPGWPELVSGQLPGGYRVSSPSGLSWEGRKPAHALRIGEGTRSVEVTLKRLRVRPSDAMRLLPTRHPKDVIDVSKVAWRYAVDTEGGDLAASPDVASEVELFASAWSIDCTLDAASHPETTLLHRWYCMVPMRTALLVLEFGSADPGWCKANWDAYRAVFNSVSLTGDPQADDLSTEVEALF